MLSYELKEKMVDLEQKVHEMQILFLKEIQSLKD